MTRSIPDETATGRAPASWPAHLGLAALCSVVAMLPMLLCGVTSSNDLGQNFQRAVTIHDSIAAGTWYPAFGAATNGGLGDLAVRFYPPLAYYVISAATFSLGDWYSGTLLAYGIFFFAGAWGTMLWAREVFSDKHALVAAGLFTFAPYHLNLIYNNGLIAEFAALGIAPFCFLYVTRMCRRDSAGDAVGLSAATALLVLTHLPSTIIIIIGLGLYATLLTGRKIVSIRSAKLVAAVIAGAAASSFYWARMLPELSWVKHSGEKYFAGIYNYQMNFLLVPRHILNIADDVLNLWPADLMLLAVILIVVPAAYYMLSERLGTKVQMVAAALFVTSIFMTTPLSTPVWTAVGFLQRVQFPWRWLGLVSLVGAVIASDGLVRLSGTLKEAKPGPMTVIMGVCLSAYVFTSAFLVKEAVYLSRTAFVAQVSILASAPSYDGWLPVWCPDAVPAAAEQVDAGGRTVRIEDWRAERRSFHIDAGPAGLASVATLYYPRWHVAVNGGPPMAVDDSDGLIALNLPDGACDVVLTFDEPGYVKAASAASGILWAAMLTGTVVLLLKSRKRHPRRSDRPF
jgi:hypothetical protein